MNRITFLLISLLLLISCSRQVNRDNQCDFTDADFDVQNMSIDEADQIAIGNIDIGMSGKIQVINDSILAVSEYKGQNLLWLINHTSNSATSVLGRGEGPEELTELTTVTYPNGKLNVAGLNDGKVLRFNIDTDSLALQLIDGARVPYQPLRSVMINDSTIFSVAPTFSGHRYSIYHTADSTVEHIDDFPLDSVYLRIKPDNTFMQSDIDITPDGELIVVANRFWPVIELFDVASKKIRCLNGPVISDAKIIKESLCDGYSYVQRPRWYTWDGITVTAKSIYIGYNGYIRSEEEKNNNTGTTRIYTFDIQGNPKKLYSFETPILSFAVDEENGLLFVMHDEQLEPRIMKYNLK